MLVIGKYSYIQKNLHFVMQLEIGVGRHILTHIYIVYNIYI